MNNVGTVGISIPTSFAWLVYYHPTSDEPASQRQNISTRTAHRRLEHKREHVDPKLTFNPIHLIVPTSRSLNGLKILSTCTFSPVLCPGFKIEVPVNVSTWIGSALYEASPTSCDRSQGSPITMVGSDEEIFASLGMNRTRPG